MARGTRRIGDAAREQRANGGARAVGRDSATVAGWQDTKARIRLRSGGRCEVRLTLAEVELSVWCYPNHGLAFRFESATGLYRCRHWAIDPAHQRRASAGAGDSPDEVYDACRTHHNMQDRASYARGKLVVIKLGGGAFGYRFIQARDKWEFRRMVMNAGGSSVPPSAPRLRESVGAQ